MLDTFHWYRGEGFGLIVEDLLARPADDFVAEFVGASRGLRRLSVTPIDVEPAPLDAGEYRNVDGTQALALGLIWYVTSDPKSNVVANLSGSYQAQTKALAEAISMARGATGSRAAAKAGKRMDQCRIVRMGL